MTLHAISDDIETPADRATELAVLAACLATRTARDAARKTLTGDDFYYAQHQAVWEAMRSLDQHGKSVDAVTLSAMLTTGTPAHSLLPDLVTTVAYTNGIIDYAAIVRSWAQKRRIQNLASRTHQRSMTPGLLPTGFAATVAAQFAAVRDAGAEDVTALTLGELLDMPDQDYDWLIPGLLERGDRLMVTGDEGLGKSSLLRQIAILAAAGIHPFHTTRRIPPIKALIYDTENSRKQFIRKARPLHTFACLNGDDPASRVMVETTDRIDITRDRDLARIHSLCDAMQPDVMVIGPLYKLVPRAINSDDEATPLLAALDTIRERGIALMIEAHPGKSSGEGGRNMAPRGSAAFMGWPEFGYGMRKIDGSQGSDFCDFIPWRGARDERAWPARMRRADHMTWVEVA